MVWPLKRRPFDTDQREVRLRSGSVAALTVLAVTTVLLSWAGPAGACSFGFRTLYLDELDETDVVAIGQPEVVARTEAARGWHRAGVMAFTSAWLVGGDAETVAGTVWTMNHGRREEGSCGKFDADTVGSRMWFHVLMADGSVVTLANSRSLDPVAIDSAFLNDRFGPPVAITLDPGLVEAAYTPLAAERRADDVSLQATLASTIVILGLGLAVARTRRSRTRKPRQPANWPGPSAR